jgi:hypothetical protein
VEQRCTCGAVLPDDARFCHKCGKPQWEDDIARIGAQEASPAPVQSPAMPSTVGPTAPGISFRNSRAVLVSLIVAAGALVAFMAISLLVPALSPLVLCAAGFTAARVYRRQSDEPLTTAAGARLGWMTGLWLFLVVAILCALVALVVANPEAWQQLKAAWSQLPQASKLLNLSQHDFVMQLLVSLPFSFLFLTLLPGLGGMLGARMSAGRRSS